MCSIPLQLPLQLLPDELLAVQHEVNKTAKSKGILQFRSFYLLFLKLKDKRTTANCRLLTTVAPNHPFALGSKRVPVPKLKLLLNMTVYIYTFLLTLFILSLTTGWTKSNFFANETSFEVSSMITLINRSLKWIFTWWPNQPSTKD